MWVALSSSKLAPPFWPGLSGSLFGTSLFVQTVPLGGSLGQQGSSCPAAEFSLGPQLVCTSHQALTFLSLPHGLGSVDQRHMASTLVPKFCSLASQTGTARQSSWNPLALLPGSVPGSQG